MHIRIKHRIVIIMTFFSFHTLMPCKIASFTILCVQYVLFLMNESSSDHLRSSVIVVTMIPVPT